ncbi:hemolysin family protein [Gracilimonas mengyeensis]|uniref:Hemolysin, contains CBS domains n=1 Tax=Gracilimonas mengyeensis TaxID=1302730 RepID=A0A521FHD8_9BACT|nr:hemolysin family protein [Gracilimonas mengyeensis]SMO95449.1 Hemolysin, contains CBS domains [Gracilimonas mengyeensis]
MIELSLIVLTIVLSGFFSGSEIAFVTANKLKLEVASRKNNFLANSIEFFTRKPETFLTTTLVGNNIVNVLYATFMAIFLVEPIQHYGELWFDVVPTELQVLVVQTIIASVVIMIFGEILPKAIFRALADSMISVISIPLRIAYYVFRPLIEISKGSSNVLIRWFVKDAEVVESYYRRQDVEMIFKELRDSGGSEDIDEDDSEILHNVLELSSKRVKDSMIPRIEIQAVEKDAPIPEVLDMFVQTGHSKLPVYRDSIDDVIGVVFAHDFFHEPKSVNEIVRPVKLVPSSKKSKDLLTEFRQSNMSVAIVLDEYGGTAGMVTIEDLLEEVVGDIQDEYDVEDEIMKKLSENTYVVSGNVEIEELMERFEEIELPLEPSEYDTVAGFIINHLGRIPKVNEEVVIEGKKFIISKATPSRIETVKLIIIE